MKNEGATCFGTVQKVHYLSARGFCFIAPDDGGAHVFAHVRDFASPIGGVERGDSVSYVVTTDDRSGKPRARSSLAASAAWLTLAPPVLSDRAGITRDGPVRGPAF
jgi:cold shock protein